MSNEYPGHILDELNNAGTPFTKNFPRMNTTAAGPQPLILGSITFPPSVRESEFESLYYELLYAVGNTYPGETRHETALRYIRNAESRDDGPKQEARR